VAQAATTRSQRTERAGPSIVEDASRNSREREGAAGLWIEARCVTIPWRPSTEREGERLDTSVHELDLELPVDDRRRLPEQLIETLLGRSAVAVRIDIGAAEQVSTTLVRFVDHRVPLAEDRADQTRVGARDLFDQSIDPVVRRRGSGTSARASGDLG